MQNSESSSGKQEGRRGPLRVVWEIISNNLRIKLLSLLLAILLWNYVISTDASITRPKTLFNLTGYVTGQSTLTTYGLALLEDPSDELTGISVTVDAPQASYSRVSADNVQVQLDLSNVRTAGTQEVRLRATSSYGRVTGISPQSLTLTFEQLDSRSVPVNCQIVGAGKANHWYNVTRVNPSVITVSGAASAVRSIASASVPMDVTDVESSTVTALPYTLLSGTGEEISAGMLNRSTSSISISLEVYPCRDIPVGDEIESVVTGEPEEGYEVKSVSIQPESILVAAEEEVLGSVEELKVRPVSVEGLRQSFSAKTTVSALSDFKYISNEEVYVNVTIDEETVTEEAGNVSVEILGLPEGAMAQNDPVGVTITGRASAVAAMRDRQIVLTADVSGLTEGTYQLAPTWNADDYPDVTLEVDALDVTITLPEEQ